MSPAQTARPSAVGLGAGPPVAGGATKPRRTRRASGEVRALILEAARESFGEKGYARSTTRDIALRANVAEVLLFRNFGSKANLFAEAALLPLINLIREWVDLTEPSTDGNLEEMEHAFVDSLYRVASDNRGILLSFLATGAFEPSAVMGGDAANRMQEAIDAIVGNSEEFLSKMGVDLEGMNVAVASRAAIGTVLAFALFDDWLLPKGRRRPKRKDIVNELTRQILYGGFNQRVEASR